MVRKVGIFRTRLFPGIALGAGLAVLIASASVAAETQEANPRVLEDVGFDQRLDQKVPLDLPFFNESGQQVTLGDYFGKQPVVLALVYYECPMLCTLVLNGLVRAMRAISLDVGKDYQVVTVSFNPREKPVLAARKKENYFRQYGRSVPEKGWTFLTGPESSIQELTKAVGFRYVWDPEARQYAHASGLTVLTANGAVSKYLYGVEFSAKDLRLALVEASAGKIGSPVDQVMLLCFHYDPATGRYGLAILRTLRAAGVLTMALLALFILGLVRRKKRLEGAA